MTLIASPPAATTRSTTNADPTLAATLAQLSSSHFRALLGTYGLTNLENVARLALPLLLGRAVDGLLRGSRWPLIGYVVAHAAYAALGVARRRWDTRAFTHIYAEEAAAVVARLHRAGADGSRVAARAAMTREFVDFFERDVPALLFAGYAMIGAAIALFGLCPAAAAGCLLMLPPAVGLNRWYAARCARVNRTLNSALEREVAVVTAGRPKAVAAQFGRVRRQKVRLSDLEAINFGLTDVMILVLMAGSMLAHAWSATPTAGELVAVSRYVVLFMCGLDSAPMLVQQLTRLQDVHRRLYASPSR